MSLDFLIKNAHKTFSITLLSAQAKILLIGGFADENDAAKAFLGRSRPNLDRRKKLNPEEKEYVELVDRYAQNTKKYVDWVRSCGGSPVWNEALVTYCWAFETCMKAIAVAFFIAEKKIDGFDAQIYIPGRELTDARHAIERKWKASGGDYPRVQDFFQSNILSMKAAKRYFVLEYGALDAAWSVCDAAFKIRNAIVHNLGVMRESVSLGEQQLHAGWPIELNNGSLVKISRSFDEILNPFDDLEGFLLQKPLPT